MQLVVAHNYDLKARGESFSQQVEAYLQNHQEVKSFPRNATKFQLTEILASYINKRGHVMLKRMVDVGSMKHR